MILANLVERSETTERLSANYWDMRIAQLDAEYDLVPVQSQRVASLQRKLAQLDSAIDSAPSAPDIQEGEQSLHAAAQLTSEYDNEGA
jgi:hypothetical protein